MPSRTLDFRYASAIGHHFARRWYTDASVRVEPGVSSNSPLHFGIPGMPIQQDSAGGRSDSSSAIQYQETRKKWNKVL